MEILEAMKERRSVRSYERRALTEKEVEMLVEAAGRAESPFGGAVTIRLKRFDVAGGYRPSTYGMIRGASDYFLLGFADDEVSAMSAGFRFEQVVLEAWRAGLGTCWIAATFKGSAFEGGEAWPEGQRLRVVSPVGVAARQSFVERVARLAAGSRNRKPFGSLFFCDGFRRPLPSDDCFAPSLEMMRLAPSSTNSQPWRALVDGPTVHFYYVPKNRLSPIDCGIGLCHFYLAEQAAGRDCRFFKAPDAPQAPDGWRYATSCRPE